MEGLYYDQKSDLNDLTQREVYYRVSDIHNTLQSYQGLTEHVWQGVYHMLGGLVK